MPGTRDRRRIPARGDLLPAFVAVGRRFVWAYSICPYEGHGHKNAGHLEMDTRHYTSPILFSGSSRPKSRVRIRSAARRDENRGCEFLQRLVAAKIGGANLFSGSSQPKSGVRICSADRRSQNRVPVFVQRLVAAKIGCLFFVSGSSRPKSGVCFCSAGRRGQNRVPVFVQRLVATKIGCLFFVSGSSRPKSGACFSSADRRGQNRGCEFVQRVVAAKIAGTFDGAMACLGRPVTGIRPPLWGRRTDTGRFTPTRHNH